MIMVDVLTYDDQYEVQLGSVISDYDRKILLRLYQPIIGYKAVSLYFNLWSELEADQTITTTKKKHLRLFDMMVCNANEFTQLRTHLEAVGLIKTYINAGSEYSKYVYRIFAPLSPNDFFAHSLLCPLLKKAFTDENEFTRTRNYFLKSVGVKSTYKEISASFTDVFKNINKLELVNLEDRYIGRTSLKVKTSFDFDAFYIGLKDYQIPKTLFTREVIDEISLLSEAYNIDAIEMRYVVMNSIEVIDGNRQINFYKMREQARHYVSSNEKENKTKKTKNIITLSGNSNIKTLLDQYNRTSTIEFFKLRNNNMEILENDIALIKELKKAGLIDSVINVLIDYCLMKNENRIIPNYIKRVAQSLIRNEIDNAYDALVYLDDPKGYKNKFNFLDSNKNKEENEVQSKQLDTSNFDPNTDKWW